jgi:diamine N-acetyltransferase
MFDKVTTEEQINLVSSLAGEIWPEHYYSIVGKAQIDYMVKTFQSPRAIAEQIERDGYLYYLLSGDNGPVGYFACQLNGDLCFLSKFYIKSGHRGKGMGRKAFQFICDLARENHCYAIHLTVNKNNLSSIRIYGKLGFSNTGAVKQDIGKGYVMDDYRMEYRIGRT